MSNDVDIYLLWLKAARFKARSDLADRQQLLNGLLNHDSTYYRSVLAIRDAEERVCAVWDAMPDSLPPVDQLPEAQGPYSGVTE